MPSTFDSFVQTSCEYFSLGKNDFANVTPNLISAFTPELPKSILKQAQDIVADLHRLTSSPVYQKQVANEVASMFVASTPIAPLLMSLDVHVTAENTLKIIEINTNASGYLVNAMSYRARGLRDFPEALTDLESNFRNTIAKGLSAEDWLVIMDETPTQQKLYIEFLMYKKFFEQKLNARCAILDPSEINVIGNDELSYQNKKVYGIYNRHTDFYLQKLPHIQRAHNAQKVNLSPHPWGYALFADKKRLLDLQNSDWTKHLRWSDYPHLEKAILKTKTFGQFASRDELWRERSKYFFKPQDSYGAKSVYNGRSISRTKFENIFSEKMLAQETAPAPELTFHHNGADEKFKYDLRFLFFQDKVQLAFARLYRGQLTNLQTPLGGHAPLVFV